MFLTCGKETTVAGQSYKLAEEFGFWILDAGSRKPKAGGQKSKANNKNINDD